MPHDRSAEPFRVVIVGAGPRGTGVLERLLANIGDLLPDHPVQIDVVDPFPPGGGRVWRAEQPELMWMNAAAENITMFTDETVRCEGPPRPGPSLSEWSGTPDGSAFFSRRDQQRYLAWVFGHVVAGRPANVTVRVHAASAERLDEQGGGRQLVRLAGRAVPLAADVVILAMGHLDAAPDAQETDLAAFADRHDLAYLPRAFSADVDLSRFRAGEPVVLRGFGLAFVDLMVLLTEHRGGRYRTGAAGELEYVPCGREPVMYVGSRRGVPYRSKFTYRLSVPPPPLPRFFDAARIVAAPGPLDFRRDLWPLLAKETGWAYYHQLFAAHAGRTTMPWTVFAARYSALGWYDPARESLIAAAVPDPADRLDLEALDQPLRGRRFAGAGDLQTHVRDHIVADLDRRADHRHSADLAAFHGLLAGYGQMAEIVASGKLAARSYLDDVCGWWQSFFEYYGSGPPSVRLRQLVALSRAGLIRFLGNDMWVTADERRGVFTAGGGGVTGAVRATGLAEARLPAATLHNSTDRLLREMVERGEAGEQILTGDGYRNASGLLHVSPDFQIRDAAGRAHPRRFAIGPFTSVRYFATFARPRADALSFRQNDRLARGVLKQLSNSR